VPAVLQRPDLARRDEHLGLGQAVAEHLGDFGYGVPLPVLVGDGAHVPPPVCERGCAAGTTWSRAASRRSRARAAAESASAASPV